MAWFLYGRDLCHVRVNDIQDGEGGGGGQKHLPTSSFPLISKNVEISPLSRSKKKILIFNSFAAQV